METINDLVEALRRGISQDGRLLKLDTLAGKNILLPHRLVAEDRVGRGYEYQLDVLSLKKDIELKQLIAQPVTLWIQQANSHDYLPVHGYVHRVSKLGFDGEFAVYQLTFSSWLHFLKHRKDARIWQDKSADDILTEIFNHHPQARGQFRFALERDAVSRSYCTQYETDWNFVMRLMEEEGWTCYHEQQADGKDHTLVIVDTVRKLPWLTPKAIEFHHAGSDDDVDKITQWRGERQLISTTLKTVTFDYKAPHYAKDPVKLISPGHGNIPAQLEVFEYTGAYTYGLDEQGNRQARNTVEGWESKAKRFFASSGVRHLAVGYCFDFKGHADHEYDPPEQREFFIIGLQWFIENNLPLGTTTTDFPGSLQQQIAGIKEKTVKQTAGYRSANRRTSGANADNYYGGGFCINHIEVQRNLVEYRSPREHHKPVMHPQSAIVAGPENEEIYTDELNRVKIKFIWNQLNPGDEAASCWVRVSYPNAGNDYGALNVPRIGQEVIVTFLDSDPDRPIITGRVYNGNQTPHWHTDGKLSGVKSKEVKGSGYNQLVMDDNTGQNRVQLYSSNTNAQLNLGYLVGQQGNERQAFYGSGFALNTDAYGAITANQGLYISTYNKPGATGSQLDVNEAHQQLEVGHQLTQALSDTAVKAQAEPLAGQDALKHFNDATQDNYSGRGQEQANRFKAPILLAASPAGIGLTTPESTHIHSGDNITLSSGTDTNLAVGQSLVASIKEKLSLFVFNGGMKLFASKGKVEIQSQSDGLDIIADKVLRLISATDKIELWAKKEITLGAGGSAIKINEDGITDITTGQRIMHHSAWSLPGPKGLPTPLPEMPKTICVECLAKRANHRSAFINKGAQ